MNAEIVKILRKCCERKAIEKIAIECCSNQMHMFIGISLKYSVSQIISYLKEKSCFIIFDEHKN